MSDEDPNASQSGDKPKMVPETDIIAVKAAAKKEQEKLKTQIQTEKDAAEVIRQELLKEQAAKEQMEKKLNESSSSLEGLEKVKTELDAANTRSKGLEDRVLEARKQVLITYNVPADKLEGKTVEQLDLLEDALKTVGAPAKQPASSYAVTTPPGGSAPVSDLDQAKDAVAEAKKRAGVPSDA